MQMGTACEDCDLAPVFILIWLFTPRREEYPAQ